MKLKKLEKEMREAAARLDTNWLPPQGQDTIKKRPLMTQWSETMEDTIIIKGVRQII